MKNLLFVILLIALIVVPLPGCETASHTTADTIPTTTQADEAMKTVYLPLTETYTYATGETKTVTYLYDEDGHLTGINRGISPDGEELICTVVCDSYGRVTEIRHDGVGGETQTYTYDELWRIASVESKNASTQYSYSPDGNLEKALFSYGGYELYTYENGLLIETAIYNASGEKDTWIAFTYDDQGRIVDKQQCSTGCLPETAHYAYSDDGLTYSYEFGGATYILTFDVNSNLIRKSYTCSFFSYECVYTYQAIEIPAHLQWHPYQDNFCN